MATTYTLSSLQWQLAAAIAAGDALTTIKGSTSEKAALAYAAGATSQKVDRLHVKNYTVGASGTLVLDFVAGAILDPLGVNPGDWFRVLGAALFLYPSPAAASITIGAGTAPVGLVGDVAANAKTLYNSATGALWIWAGGDAGVLTTAATADKLTITNNDGALGANFDLVLFGRST